MKVRAANCPSCGGPVEFKMSSSLVTICEFCNCVVARGDKSVKDHGKVADLVITDSPLELSATGKYRKKRFEVVGRVQYQHAAGGSWNEWYLAFSNGKWGWLSEAQGKFFLTFEKNVSEPSQLPSMDSLEPGEKFKLGSHGEFTIAEVGTAKTGAAEGEIPWNFTPNTPHPFADLSGPDGKYATLDYSEPEAKFYFGEEVALDDLDIVGGWGMAGGIVENRVQALAVNCPHCGGPLSLQTPNETQRVACPHCKSMLSCDQGKLEYLTTLGSRGPLPLIPLGATGKIKDTEFTVIGFMERYARYAGTIYPWTEYLLYNSKVGYRWLIRNDRHWSFAEPVAAHDAQKHWGHATFKGHRFRIYDRGDATVRHVLGEFYWKVQVGERVDTSDYISPPQMLSFESSGDEKSRELNVSLCTYLSVEEIEKAFGINDLPQPWGVGVIQPKPQFGDVFHLWALFLAGFIGLYVFLNTVITKGVDFGFFVIMLGLVSAIPIGTIIYAHNFEVQRWKDSDYSPYASDDD